MFKGIDLSDEDWDDEYLAAELEIVKTQKKERDEQKEKERKVREEEEEKESRKKRDEEERRKRGELRKQGEKKKGKILLPHHRNRI